MINKKIYIVEDDPLIADSLQSILEEMGHTCIGIADNAFDALGEISNLKPDLLLLDINIEGEKDGIDLALSIQKNQKVPFMFVTAYADPKTVERCKSTNPIGYIIKPFRDVDIRVAIDLALSKSTMIAEPDKQDLDDDRFIYFKDNTEYKKVDVNDILYVQANDIYSDLFLQESKILISKSLKKIEERFQNKGFIRIHRSYLINISKIEKIIEDQVLINNKLIPIGRSYKSELINRLQII